MTFEPLVDDAPPADLPTASDPAAGYSSADITDAGYLPGLGETHPAYSHFTDMDNWNDVGVVVLEEAAASVPVTEITDDGTLDAIARRDLRKTLFRAVG